MSEPLDKPTFMRLMRMQEAHLLGIMASLAAGPRPFIDPPPKPKPLPEDETIIWHEKTGDIYQIGAAVCEVWGLPIAAMPSPRRSRLWSWPRGAAMHMCTSLVPHYSLPAIGRKFGRDHTTVLYARAACQYRLDSKDKSLAVYRENYAEAEKRARIALRPQTSVGAS